MKRLVSLFPVLLFFVRLIGRAQDTATIVGTVTDATGAVIPRAKVTVSNPRRVSSGTWSRTRQPKYRLATMWLRPKLRAFRSSSPRESHLLLVKPFQWTCR